MNAGSMLGHMECWVTYICAATRTTILGLTFIRRLQRLISRHDYPDNIVMIIVTMAVI